MSLRLLAVFSGVVLVAACASADQGSPARRANPTTDPPPDGNGDTPDGGGAPPPTVDGGSDAAGLPPYEVVTKFGHRLIRTVTVHKNGGEDRTVWVEESKIGQLPANGPLPNGARLLMDTGGAGGFVLERVNGAWQYSTDVTNLTTAPTAGCNGCHNGAAEPGVFTLPSLRRLIQTHKGEEKVCAMGPGPQPCSSSVYQ